ncbi:MAG: DUF6051 family protein [Paludibacteraceae bacterium]|jgi:hypothetical protein|nr:DUF6051 family protein [Paludibacteraceae bacterium]
MKTDFEMSKETHYIFKKNFEGQSNFYIENSNMEIQFATFRQQKQNLFITRMQQALPSPDFCYTSDATMSENQSFQYPVFRLKDTDKSNKCIILLHGLNERSWEKYWQWATYLVQATGKTVILFPIAFHMNRTPQQWYNPRTILQWLQKRKHILNNPENLTFANLAMSDRLTMTPLRFYTSGCETAYNIWQLMDEIDKGEHPYLKPNTDVDFFAYSIGAYLAQALLMSNPDGYFTNSRLFMFCGGSLFDQMNGNSKYIMDKQTFDKMLMFYNNDFLALEGDKNNTFDRSFRAMINANIDNDYRTEFFSSATHRIHGIALTKDIVMPISGIKKALGEKVAENCIEEMDFPFDYTHEHPFPQNNQANPELVAQMFQRVFSTASNFLA